MGTRFGEWGEGRFQNGLQQSKTTQGVLLFFPSSLRAFGQVFASVDLPLF